MKSLKCFMQFSPSPCKYFGRTTSFCYPGDAQKLINYTQKPLNFVFLKDQFYSIANINRRFVNPGLISKSDQKYQLLSKRLCGWKEGSK